MTMSGAIPYAASSRVSAMSTVSTAGCVISVCLSSSSACATASGSAVGEDDIGRAAALEQRRHDASASSNSLGDDRLAPAQVREHVRVLRALAGVEERDLARGAAAAEDAARAQRRPSGGVARLQRLQRQLGLRDEVGAVGVVDRDPLRRAQRLGARTAPGRGAGPGAPRRAPSAARWRAPPRRRGAEHERAAQRRLRRSAARAARRAPPTRGGHGAPAPTSAVAGSFVADGRARTPPARRGSWCRRSRTRSRRRRACAPSATSQSRSSVLTANGDAVQSTFGFGRSKFRLGGSTLSCSASAP